MPVSWASALAWRLRRQLLDRPGSGTPADVVRVLGAVAAQDAELAVAARRAVSRGGDLAVALAEGTVIKTFAFRGATHLLTPEDGGAYLALRAASRMWERTSWQSYYGLTPEDWPPLRAAVREALTDGPLTHDELGAALTSDARFRHLDAAFARGAWTLIKPMAWQGDLSFGPSRGGTATFQRLDLNPRWTGLPDLEAAGTSAVEAYVRAYGPTTPERLHYWLGSGLGVGRRRILGWIAALDARLARIELEGEPALVLRSDVDDLVATPATAAVHLLPRYDQWVLGPGTADEHVVPAVVRPAVSRGANLVLVGGRVSGTWTQAGDEVDVVWTVPGAPDEHLAPAVDRWAAVVGRPLTLRSVAAS